MRPLNAYNAVRPPVVGAREQEAVALRLSARKLKDATDRTSRATALRLNHALWTLILRDLSGENNRLPPVLKRDCVALAVFSLDYSTRAVLNDASLQPLIDLNERVAEGLESGPTTASMPSVALRAPPPPAPTPVALSA